ncbi:MAG TPA: chemotaxis protein CheW [Ramlibacter sp.]|uniref:chemotaxis protein CheW n=1 Tax=Ramlibacter sp. TaxID=1917967 RepID=UPI002C4D1909|nr:chemotaxis protein CheW [Ramlibacter sp.]HVZ43473.1 chemotaxis protein CheW [Ramlibacter sp.]
MIDANDDVLRARARELARPLDAAGAAGAAAAGPESLQVIEFGLGRERYAFEAHWVREVRPLRQLTPVPCTPSHVLGVVNLRGQILAVIDIRRFFGIEQRGLGELDKMIVLASASMEFGVLADVVPGHRSIAADRLQASIATFGGIHQAYLRGVTTDGLAVLDAPRLLGDERLVVRAEFE